MRGVNYTNNSSRLRLRGDAQPSTGSDADVTVLSLESSKHGLCLRVRKQSTAARRKLATCKIALAALVLTTGLAQIHARPGCHPFASNAGVLPV